MTNPLRSADGLGVRQVLARSFSVPPAFLVGVEIPFFVHADFLSLPLVGPEDHEIGMLGEGPGPLGLDGPRPLLAAIAFSLNTR